jgi:hypothetical protein
MPKLKFHNATRQKRITSSYKGIAVGDDFNAIQLGQHFPGARIKVGAPQIPGVTAENLRSLMYAILTELSECLLSESGEYLIWEA